MSTFESFLGTQANAVIDLSQETIAVTTAVTPTSTVDATIMNVTSSNGGVFRGLNIAVLNTTAQESITLNNIKITVDGASEQTLTYDMIINRQLVNASAGSSAAGFGQGAATLTIPEIKYSSSFTLKINLTSGVTLPKVSAVYTEYS